jgi:hypothetical protein
MKAILLGAAVLVAGLLGPGAGHAQVRQVMLETIPEAPARKVVVELFTSQNCAMCPPANRNVAALARRADVVALTYPVGYWDYLGAADKLARPEFEARQKRYNQSLGQRGPYTPQMVFGGLLHSSGGDLAKISQKFSSRDTAPHPVSVSFDGGDALLAGDPDGTASIVVVRYRPGHLSEVPKQGANRGKDLTYFNLVTDLEEHGFWRGGEARFRVDCVRACVVIVHANDSSGPIIGVGHRP